VDGGQSGGARGTTPSVGSELSSAIGVAASILGLAGYVYLIGGIVSWVRFGAARLPSDAAVSALASSTLFEAGLRAILYAAVLFTAVCVVAYFAVGNWDANGPDWHEVILNQGVGRAKRALDADPHAAEARTARRNIYLAPGRERRWDGVATIAERAKLPARVAIGAKTRRDRARADRRRATRVLAGRADDGKPALGAHRTAALGDQAVRVIAGFNNLVLSAVVGLAAAKLVEWLFSSAWWLILAVWLLAGFCAHRALVSWGPLRWGLRQHFVAWAVVAAAALFIAAPIGLLVIAAVAVSTLGRALARVARPNSLAGLLRSPLP
jgi:hypothetical protein